MKTLKIKRSQISKTSFFFLRHHHVTLLLAGMLLFAAPAAHSGAQAQSWAQVGPTTGAVESPWALRSGIVTDIDVSQSGGEMALTTAWGGYFVGNGSFNRFSSRTDTIPTGRMRSLARCPADGRKAVVATGSSPSLGGDDWGLGLFYTGDDGMNWQPVVPSGLYTGGWRFEKVRWGAGSIVFAASNRGLYRSTNYGMPGSWYIVLGDTRENLPRENYAPSTDVFDIAVDPDSPSTVYIVTGDGRLLKSTSNGSVGTWRQMALPLTMRDGRTPFDRTRISRGTRMAIPKMNPSSVYLMVADSAGLYGMFHSTNYGDGHWSADDLGTCAVRPTPRCSALAASPTNSNLLLAGGYSSQACRSIDGGRSWSQLGPGAASLHWDHTAIAFNDSGRAFIGGDGGIAYSTDRDAGSWATKGMGLHAPTVVSFDISATDPHYQYMATWDTGLWATNGGAAWISTQQDTFDIEADPTNAQLAWAAIGPGGEDRFATVDGGLHFDPFNGNLGSSPSAGRIRTNGRSSLLTAGGRAVFSTTVPATPRPSGGIPAPHWTRWPNARTPDFSGNIAGLTVNRPGDGVQLFVYAWIGRNPDQSPPRNKLYVFDSRSFAWRVSGTRADGTEYFPAPILQLATSADGRLAYAITEDNSIFASSDYGESWNSAAGSNPPAEMWDVLIDPTNPSRVFVAAAGGVYQSYQSTTPRVWRNWSLGLPFVNGAGTHFARLRAAASGGTTYLYATVLGRGIFRREITADP